MIEFYYYWLVNDKLPNRWSSEVISSEEPLREHFVVAKYYAKECSLSDSSDASVWGFPSEMENKFLVL